nr:purine and other phosphorylase-like protein, family 1 [Azomonas macrocytogenes]
MHSVGIVVALKAEADAFTAQASRPECLVPLAEGCGLLLSGMGPGAARKAAQNLVDAGAQALATFGVAGALEPGLRSGTLLCPQRILDESGRVYTADPAWRDRLQQRLTLAALPMITDATLLSLPEPLSTATAKMAAQSRYAATAVDMESAAVAAVAADRGLPFVALRSIIDERDDMLPEALQAAIDPWGRPRPLKLIATLVHHPWLLARLPGLSSRMGKAVRALRAAAAAAGAGLGLPGQG